MRIDNKSLMDILKVIYDVENEYLKTFEIYEQAKKSLTKLEQRTYELENQQSKYNQFDENEFLNFKDKVGEIKHNLRDQLKKVISVREGNFTVYNWRYLTSDEIENYQKVSGIESHINNNSIIISSFSSLDFYKLLLSTTQPEHKKFDFHFYKNHEFVIAFSFNKNRNINKNINVYLLIIQGDNIILSSKLSYKDILKYLLLESDEKIVPSNLQLLKNDNFILNLIEFITMEAESKNSLFNDSNFTDLDLVLDEIWLDESKNKKD